MTWTSRRSKDDHQRESETELRERVAAAIAQIRSHRFATSMTELESLGRRQIIHGVADDTLTQFSLSSAENRRSECWQTGGFLYRRLRAAERVRTGKQWLKMANLCGGLGDASWNALAYAVRAAPLIDVDRAAKAGRTRAVRFDFDLVAVDGASCDEADDLAVFLDEHRVTASVLSAYVSVRDGRLVGVRMVADEFATCMEPSKTVHLVTEYFEFGVDVPEFQVPSDDQVFVRVAEKREG